MVTAHVTVPISSGDAVQVWPPADAPPSTGRTQVKVHNLDSSHAVELLGDSGQTPGTGWTLASAGGLWDSLLEAGDKVWALGLTSSVVVVEVSGT